MHRVIAVVFVTIFGVFGILTGVLLSGELGRWVADGTLVAALVIGLAAMGYAVLGENERIHRRLSFVYVVASILILAASLLVVRSPWKDDERAAAAAAERFLMLACQGRYDDSLDLADPNLALSAGELQEHVMSVLDGRACKPSLTGSFRAAERPGEPSGSTCGSYWLGYGRNSIICLRDRSPENREFRVVYLGYDR